MPEPARAAAPGGARALPSILQRILDSKAQRLAAAVAARPRQDVIAAAAGAPAPRDFAAALARPGAGARIIAEIKRRSPSKGLIRADFDPAALAAAYQAGGADACSVLTEEDHFGGRLDDLGLARGAASLPLLRKDFLFDDYQVHEARAAGADAVLLIAAVLEPARLLALAVLANELGMAALVEVHDEHELEPALACPRALIGINNRDLRTFRVDLATSERLAPLVPAGRLIVAESGIASRRNIERLQAAGINAFLIGEHFMRAADPGGAVAALKAGAA